MTATSDAVLVLLEDAEINRNWLREQPLTVSEWADAHRILDPLFSQEHGPWRTSRVPYAREWMDSATVPWVRQITLMTATQLGKSEACNNILGFYLQHRPSPVMFVLPSTKAARMVAKRRIKPMIVASPALRAELTENAHDFSTFEIALRRSVVYMRSAEVPADLASTSVRLLIGDETGKWPDWTGDEANPLALARERLRTFYDSKILLTSTPKRRGLIDREFATGDQRRYHMPCVHCSAWITFEWPQVKWDTEKVHTAKEMQDQQSAWYECQRCHAAITDLHKTEMIARGVWVPLGQDPQRWLSIGRVADRAPHRSYHLWAAYSPWLAWWKIIAEFLRSKEDPSLLMNFVTSWLAEVWEERVQQTTDAAVEACLEARTTRHVPDEVLVVTAAVDVQKDRLEWMVQGWGLDEESWVLDAGRIPLMADAGDWRQLGDVLFRSSWGKHQVRSCFIDSRGGRGDEVLDFVRRWHPAAKMIAGVERDGPEQFGSKAIDRHPRTGRPLPQTLTLWTVNVGWFKDLVASRLAKALSDPESKSGRIHLPQGLPENWIEQISAEHKVRERSGNRWRERWVIKPGKGRNEAWDLLVYSAACARQAYVNTLVSPGHRAVHLQKPRASGPPIRRRPPGSDYPSLGGRR